MKSLNGKVRDDFEPGDAVLPDDECRQEAGGVAGASPGLLADTRRVWERRCRNPWSDGEGERIIAAFGRLFRLFGQNGDSA